MFKGIFNFELEYRRNRSVTYIYFALTFIVSFLLIASPARTAVGQMKANAPYIISLWTLVISFVFTMVTSAVMGVAIVRDFDYNTEAILFSNAIKKRDYLLGRFCGSFVVLVLINCGIWLGLMAAFAIGKIVPWDVGWRTRELLSFQPWHYFQPFLLLTVTNLFITGALFFMSGALGRNTIVIYTQGILLIVIYQIVNIGLADLETQKLAAILDPFGIKTFQYVTRYWTPSEQNTLLAPLTGVMLYNRLLWISIGALALVITYYGFSFNVARKFVGSRKPETIAVRPEQSETIRTPHADQVINAWTHILQGGRLSVFYFKMIWKEIPFIAIVGSGLLLMLVNAFKMNAILGTSSYPTTFSILTVIGSFNVFLLIVAVFYSGELIWKERNVNFNLILDAMPVPSAIGLAAKFLALVLIYMVLLLLLITAGVLIQAMYGYFEFDLSVYFATLYSGTLSFLLVYTLLSFFIQVLVNNKFLGFALCILFFLISVLSNRIGIDRSLLQFGSGGLGTYSDMNMYGHFVRPFSWLKIYWLSFSATLFVVAVVFCVRGSDVLLNLRWRSGRQRLTRPVIIFVLMMLVTFLCSGSYIYYNTDVLNVFETQNEVTQRKAEYEKTLRKFRGVKQPKIVSSNIKVDLYPSVRDFAAEGFYYVKNKSDKPIAQIHIQHNLNYELSIVDLNFDRPAKVKEAFPEFRYFIYELDEALQPGDSLRIDFSESYVTKGFKDSGSNTDIVFNGTFFNNSYFPSIGYNPDFELIEDDDRREHGLPVKERMRERDDHAAKEINAFGDDADQIRFEIVLGTEGDQIAIAPGYLQKEWLDGDRKYFHYKMDRPMANFYSIVSARYAVKRDKWNDVDLEIYYHPGHEYNLDRMMDAMKDALQYNSNNFSDYQHRQLRIMEFPRYATFAQSFATTIPFSEGLGFILKVADPDKDLDVAYYITAHEVAHQWWGHQVIAADVKGSTMLSESMAQYSALMVMKKNFPPEILERYLKYELDTYLKGRTNERKKEQPLQFVEAQNYIHYNKASLVFYALQDYIGEEKLNTVFRKYNEMWRFRDAPYPTSEDLLANIREATPDSLQYLIHDMFETITLFENKAVRATYEQASGGEFEVTFSVTCDKIRSDSLGTELSIPINDWIDVGIYSRDRNGDDKLVYLQKHRITAKENTFIITLDQIPSKAGIDPLHKLIDRHSQDNTVEATKIIDITNLPLGN